MVSSFLRMSCCFVHLSHVMVCLVSFVFLYYFTNMTVLTEWKTRKKMENLLVGIKLNFIEMEGKVE